MHLALAAIVNACFDLWAKTRGVPLWRLLLNLSYLDDEPTSFTKPNLASCSGW